MAGFGTIFGGVKQPEYPAESGPSESSDPDDDSDEMPSDGERNMERMKLLYGGAQGLFGAPTPQHATASSGGGPLPVQLGRSAGKAGATAVVARSPGAGGGNKRKAASPDGGTPEPRPNKRVLTLSASKKAKQEEQARAKQGLLDDYLTMIKQASVRVKKMRQRRDQANRQREKELPGRMKDIAAQRSRENRQLKADAEREARAAIAEKKRLERLEAKQAKEAEKAIMRAERERAREVQREQRRELKEAQKDAAAKKRREEMEQRRIEREQQKEEEKEKRKLEKEIEKVRKAEEEIRAWEERQAVPDDLQLPFDPARIPPSPTPFEWIPRDSPLLDRWREHGDPSYTLPHATGDVLALLEFMQHFKTYFKNFTYNGATAPPLTLHTLQAVLFGDSASDMQTAFEIHLAMMRPLMVEDRQNKVWCTDWLEERNCTLDIVRFPTLLRIILETHVYFYSAHADVLERMDKLDYVDLPPPDRLVILGFLRDELLNTPTMRKRYEDTTVTVRGLNAEIQQLNQMARAAKGDKVPALCSELVKTVREQKDIDGRVLWKPTFASIPTPDELPEYRAVIVEPISLTEIDKKIESGVYASVEECFEDIRLMCQNAFTFNAPGSWVYGDAEQMLLASEEKLESLRMRESVVRQQKEPSAAAAAAAARPRTAFDEEVDKLSSKIDKVNRSIRSCILGQDRYFNQYFLLNELPGLHVRRAPGLFSGAPDDLEFDFPKPDIPEGGADPHDVSPEEKALREQHLAANPVKAAWTVYKSESDFTKLQACLNTLGEREKHLAESLVHQRGGIMTAMRAARDRPFVHTPPVRSRSGLASTHLANLIRIQLSTLEENWLQTTTTMQPGWSERAPAIPPRTVFAPDVTANTMLAVMTAPPPPIEPVQEAEGWDVGAEKDEETTGKHAAIPGFYYNVVRRKYVRRSKKKMAAEKKAAERKAAEEAAAAAVEAAPAAPPAAAGPRATMHSSTDAPLSGGSAQPHPGTEAVTIPSENAADPSRAAERPMEVETEAAAAGLAALGNGEAQLQNAPANASSALPPVVDEPAAMEMDTPSSASSMVSPPDSAGIIGAPTSTELTVQAEGTPTISPPESAAPPELGMSEVAVAAAPVVLVDAVGPQWRQRLVEATTVNELAQMLAELIDNLGPRALKLSWEKPVDWKSFYATTVSNCTSFTLLGSYASIIDRCVMEKAKRIGERERTMKKVTKASD